MGRIRSFRPQKLVQTELQRVTRFWNSFLLCTLKKLDLRSGHTKVLIPYQTKPIFNLNRRHNNVPRQFASAPDEIVAECFI